VALKQERRGGPPPTYSSANLFYALSVVLPHFSHMGPRSHPGITGNSLSLETSGVEQCHRCTLLMCAPDLSGSATGCDCKVTRGANRKPFACKILECSAVVVERKIPPGVAASAKELSQSVSSWQRRPNHLALEPVHGISAPCFFLYAPYYCTSTCNIKSCS
jgi:hypothetical protein